MVVALVNKATSPSEEPGWGRKYTAGTNSSPEHPSGSKNQEKPNLGRLDSPSAKKKQKPKRSKWTCEEYKQVITL